MGSNIQKVFNGLYNVRTFGLQYAPLNVIGIIDGVLVRIFLSLFILIGFNHWLYSKGSVYFSKLKTFLVVISVLVSTFSIPLSYSLTAFWECNKHDIVYRYPSQKCFEANNRVWLGITPIALALQFIVSGFTSYW
jgi:hypothetical protein